ncbi:MAG: glutaminase A [Halobacteriovoraceae bacterium]|nr:glutaminase A [Halobacteriovoraceae bacterium]
MSNTGNHSENSEQEIFQLFNCLDLNQDGQINKWDLVNALEDTGLWRTDPRVKDIYDKARIRPGVSSEIDFQGFKQVASNHMSVIKKVLKGDLIIPDFVSFTHEIEKIYAATKTNSDGKVADYIPQLKRVHPDKYAISVCTIDGQQFSLGDTKDHFSIQSIMKPINYSLALDEFGEEKVHQHVGREPSGHSFNEITLDYKGRPHNPLINAGAIMTSSLVKPSLDPAERFDYVLNKWSDLSGGMTPRFNNAVYLSEKQTADRNFALAYFMREKGSFPENVNLEETLDFYFQCCSIEVTSEAMAIAAATLAASGLNPLTGKRVLTQDTVKNCLSVMFSCGMYDFSGEFAFTVGLPAKSGVGGGLMLVIPGLMGICVWAPPLDKNGNSVKGIDFSQRLVNRFNFHIYDSLVDIESKKIDPKKRKNFSKVEGAMTLCWAAAQGDLNEVIHLVSSGVDINQADYDGRTPLHLAAAEGQAHIVDYLISKRVILNPRDRWNNTPIDDAKRGNHTEVLKLLDNTRGKDSDKIN